MAGCTQGCKEEFKRSNFLLHHDPSYVFVTSQWTNCRCSSLFYVIYRLIVAAGFAVMLALQVVKYWSPGGEGWHFFSYISNFAFMILTLDTFLQFIFVVHGYSHYKKANGMWEKAYTYMPWYGKLSWVITNIATAGGFVVTAFFWGLVYSPSFELDYNVQNIHTVNSIYLFVNLWITAMPVRIYHVFHVYIFAITYAVLTVIYQLAFDQSAVYTQLDWTEPALAVGYTFGLAIIGTTIVWLLYYALYRLRVAIFQAMTKYSESEPSVASPRDVHPMVANTGASHLGYGLQNPGYVTSVYVE